MSSLPLSMPPLQAMILKAELVEQLLEANIRAGAKLTCANQARVITVLSELRNTLETFNAA